jgi:hypothetical protein
MRPIRLAALAPARLAGGAAPVCAGLGQVLLGPLDQRGAVGVLGQLVGVGSPQRGQLLQPAVGLGQLLFEQLFALGVELDVGLDAADGDGQLGAEVVADLLLGRAGGADQRMLFQAVAH